MTPILLLGQICLWANLAWANMGLDKFGLGKLGSWQIWLRANLGLGKLGSGQKWPGKLGPGKAAICRGCLGIGLVAQLLFT